MTDLLEALMILCFGISWPISIQKSWVARTAKGKSVYLDWLYFRYRPKDSIVERSWSFSFTWAGHSMF